ncbi:putative membrane protein [Sphingobium sp. B1D7B]|uniref:DUF2061 domain-containing protein n=1 Tax=unclassified Sphingobium TaxID=2611147 RepID=UPI00222520E6|nr:MULTISPECIES: DUF2061 domain-containing protein [unclassified Sphingobium]MCW2392952.1 putative membrane protein [Sphingobium sp. B11D3A]MCW2404754.1 putative membrane protein [Sphingobium sp. B1D7B]
MPRDLTKTLTYLAVHLTVGFTVAYLLTGSLAMAGGIALIEPAVNAVAFFFHEKAWKAADARAAAAPAAVPGAAFDTRMAAVRWG